MDQELIDMADMFAICSKQEEKYTTWVRWGIPWKWEDCIAARDLVVSQLGYIKLPVPTRIVYKPKHYSSLDWIILCEILSELYHFPLSGAYYQDKEACILAIKKFSKDYYPIGFTHKIWYTEKTQH